MNSNKIDLNENFEVIYFAKRNMAGVAMQLINTSIAIFNQCDIIKELSFLTESINKDFKEIDINKLGRIAFQETIDNVRIVMCFENYMKAVLLSKGYIVHEIDRKLITLHPISNKIKNKEPILISEFLNYESFYSDGNKICKIKGIRKETLQFSVLLNEKYQSIISLPPSLKIILKKRNEKRNHLHFQNSFRFNISKQVINELIEIKEFVDSMPNASDTIILENNLTMRHLKNEIHRNIMT